MPHSVLSPSAAKRWMKCPASLVLSQGLPDESSPAAEEGTRAHRIAELTLRDNLEDLMALTADEKAELTAELHSAPEEMTDAVAVYLKEVTELLEHTPGELIYADVEHRLDVSEVTGEPGGVGTADFLAVKGTTLIVADFKYGAGVLVELNGNPQISIYLCAALLELDPEGMFFGVTHLTGSIIQPRMNHCVASTAPVENAERFRAGVRQAGERALNLLANCKAEQLPDDAYFCSPEVCKFCWAKCNCQALCATVSTAVLDEFPDADDDEKAEQTPALPKSLPVPSDPESLARAYAWLPLIKQWTDAVDKRVLDCLKQGKKVPGYKLVAGRAGPRKWKDPDAAAAELVKALGVKHAYEKPKPLSPTTCESLVKKDEIGPRYWARLQSLIERSEGKPAVVPESDPRPELTTATDEFETQAIEKGN